MKKGEKLTYEQVCGRIREAVASIIDDNADTAKLHNSVACGKVESSRHFMTRRQGAPIG